MARAVRFDKEFDRIARASLLIDIGRLDLAIAQLSRILADEPADARAHTLLAFAYDRSGRQTEARAIAERAVALAPRDAAAFVTLGMLCEPYDTVRARKAYEEAVRLAPDDAAARLYLAQLRANEGAKSEAMAIVRRALAIDPANAAARAFLKRLLLEAGRHEEAAREKSTTGNRGLTLDRFRERLRLEPLALEGRRDYARAIIDRSVAASFDRYGEGTALIAFIGLCFGFIFHAVPATVFHAAIVISATVGLIKRPLRVAALAEDRISRSFLDPGTLAINPLALGTGFAFCAAGLIGVANHFQPLGSTTFGLLLAAVLLGRSGHDPRVRYPTPLEAAWVRAFRRILQRFAAGFAGIGIAGTASLSGAPIAAAIDAAGFIVALPVALGVTALVLRLRDRKRSRTPATGALAGAENEARLLPA